MSRVGSGVGVEWERGDTVGDGTGKWRRGGGGVLKAHMLVIRDGKSPGSF